MKLLKRILATVDFDGAEECVLKAAGTLAKQFSSEVVLLHAMEPAPHALGTAAYREVMISRGRERPLLATSGSTTKLNCGIYSSEVFALSFAAPSPEPTYFATFTAGGCHLPVSASSLGQ